MKHVGFIAIWIIVIATTLYSVLTGDSIGTNLHYNAVGRIVNLVVLVIIVAYGLYSWRKLRALDRKLEELEAEHDQT